MVVILARKRILAANERWFRYRAGRSEPKPPLWARELFLWAIALFFIVSGLFAIID